MWEMILIALGIVVIAGFWFAYHKPELFKKTVDQGTEAAKKAAEELKNKVSK